MMNIQGKIFDGEKLILDDVGLTLNFKPATNTAHSVWNGSFYTKSYLVLDLQKEYRLELSDGRSGQIFIEAPEQSGDRYFVAFMGTGALS